MNTFVHGGDMPGLKALMKRMEDPHHSVLVGVPAGAQEADGTSIADVAMYNEFGAPEANVPERPVLRQGARRAMKEGTSLNAAGLRAVIEGKKTLEQVVNLLGVAAVGAVKREFVSPSPAFAPNAPATKERKGSSRPLVDTGQYRQSITYTTEDQAGTGGRVVT